MEIKLSERSLWEMSAFELKAWLGIFLFSSYTFIQPIILAALFVIQLIRREETSKLNLVGGILCVSGINFVSSVLIRGGERSRNKGNQRPLDI